MDPVTLVRMALLLSTWLVIVGLAHGLATWMKHRPRRGRWH
jgi:hypothetical protein